MNNQKYTFRIIEHILHLYRLLEEHHLDLSQVRDGIWPSGQLSAEDAKEYQLAMECISFMDEIPGGFFIYYADGDEQIIFANRGVLRMFQCATLKEFRELTGNSFKGVVHPDDLEAVEDSIQKQIRSNQQDFDYVEYRIRRKDGSVQWVDDYGHLLRSNSGRDVFYVFLGNLSDERILHQNQQMKEMQALTEAFEKADLAVKAKNSFLSQISHEMRTPLNAIFGFLTLAQISLDEPEAIEDYLKQIEIASHQLFNMISQALDASALSTAENFAGDECNLCDIVQEVFDFLLPQAQENGLEYSLNIGNIPHPNVYTTPDRFRQMVLNLINNAITYTKPGGKVEITLLEEKALSESFSVYQLQVQDTGIGIEESFIERIFEPFSRESTSTLSGIKGIGLGLTIVKRTVDLLGGSISVKSEVQKGSTFTVTIPFQIQADTAPAQQAPSSHLHILLVEDNEINREIETNLLERQGFIVDSVDNGLSALEKVKSASPDDYDLILMDLLMPGMNGWELAASIRELADPALAHIPIIALSANVQYEDRRKSLESGIDVHLPKPMNFDLMLETIKKITKKTPFDSSAS